MYEKRTTQLPTKEGFRPENSTSAGFPTRKQGFSPENGGFLYGNSQSKGKETKLNKKKDYLVSNFFSLFNQASFLPLDHLPGGSGFKPTSFARFNS